jgi:hypothetical protein
MTNGIEPEHDPAMQAIAQATNDMAAMAAQRHAEAAVIQETQAVIGRAQAAIDDAERDALTPKEQEARLAAEEAAYEAYHAQRAAEIEEDIELYRQIDGPEAEIG